MRAAGPPLAPGKEEPEGAAAAGPHQSWAAGPSKQLPEANCKATDDRGQPNREGLCGKCVSPTDTQMQLTVSKI